MKELSIIVAVSLLFFFALVVAYDAPSAAETAPADAHGIAPQAEPDGAEEPPPEPVHQPTPAQRDALVAQSLWAPLERASVMIDESEEYSRVNVLRWYGFRPSESRLTFQELRADGWPADLDLAVFDQATKTVRRSRHDVLVAKKHVMVDGLPAALWYERLFSHPEEVLFKRIPTENERQAAAPQ